MNLQRVTIYSSQFWPEVNLEAMKVIDLADGLSNHGLDVTVVAPQRQPSWPGELAFRHYLLHRVPCPHSGPWRVQRFQRHLLKRIAADAARTPAAGHFLLGVGAPREAGVLAKVARQIGAPAAAMIGRESKPHEVAGRGVPRSWLRWLPRPLPIVTSCPATFEWMKSQSSWATRVNWLPPVVGRLRSPLEAAEALQSREALAKLHPLLDASPNALVALAVLPMDGDPGSGDLLHAWKRVIRRHRQARLWLVGAGPDARSIEREIQQLGLGHSAILIGCFDDWDDLFATATVYVHSARWQGDCSALKMALLKGVCSIATDAWTGSAPATTSGDNTVRDTPEGDGNAPIIRVAAGNAESLAAAIIRQFDDVPAAQVLGAQARHWAEPRISHCRVLPRWLHWMDQVAMDPMGSFR